MDFVLAGLGLTILLLAGDALVKGAVNLSVRLGVPAMIVSLTIVAVGTSAPELLIALQAVMTGAPDIALGNVVGSNTANILLVLGIPAIITVLHTSACDTRKSYLTMLGVTLLFIAFAMTGTIRFWHGLVLVAVLAVILFGQFREAQSHREAAAELQEPEGMDPSLPGWRIALLLLLGLAGLPLGADLLVDSGVSLARTYGISETVIGLTLIAIGTSLPELATTVMAAIRRNADVALGNVIGSNMFNLAAIIGITALVSPIPVAPDFLRVDLWVMLASSLALIPFVFFGRDMGRLAGVVLTLLYIAYLVFLLV